MSPSNSDTVEKLTAEIVEILSGTAAAVLRAADLILSGLRCFDTTLAWLEWGRKDLKVNRRSMFRYAKVAEFLRRVMEDTGKSAQCALLEACGSDLCKLEIISAIPVDRLKDFSKAHELFDLDRDAIRSAVDAFLNREKKESRQLDFFAKLKLPPPNVLHEQLKKAGGSIDPNQAFSYGATFLASAAANKTKVSKEDLIQNIEWLRRHLKHLEAYVSFLAR